VDELGAEAIVELLEAFLTETPKGLDELNMLAGGADQPTLRRAAHSLKGSAALFGATELEAAAQDLEVSAANVQTEGQIGRVASLWEIYERTRPVLQEVLKELKG
jgi:HPt (histidine-containing phosphotransfer) domain-containing protein